MSDKSDRIRPSHIAAAKLKMAIAERKGEKVSPWIRELASRDIANPEIGRDQDFASRRTQEGSWLSGFQAGIRTAGEAREQAESPAEHRHPANQGQHLDPAETPDESIRQDETPLPEIRDFARDLGVNPDDPGDPYIASVREDVAEAIKKYGPAPTGKQIFGAYAPEAVIWDAEEMGEASKVLATAAIRADRARREQSGKRRRDTA